MVVTDPPFLIFFFIYIAKNRARVNRVRVHISAPLGSQIRVIFLAIHLRHHHLGSIDSNLTAEPPLSKWQVYNRGGESSSLFTRLLWRSGCPVSFGKPHGAKKLPREAFSRSSQPRKSTSRFLSITQPALCTRAVACRTETSQLLAGCAAMHSSSLSFFPQLTPAFWSHIRAAVVSFVTKSLTHLILFGSEWTFHSRHLPPLPAIVISRLRLIHSSCSCSSCSFCRSS